jgi:hypothetical protein
MRYGAEPDPQALSSEILFVENFEPVALPVNRSQGVRTVVRFVVENAPGQFPQVVKSQKRARQDDNPEPKPKGR